MNILAIDTALGACSAAVLSGGRVLARRHEEMLRGHAEALAPMVRDVMAESGLAFRQLDRLAVTTGPGTFTGQRVGLAFVRALVVALQRPAVGITTLDAIAAEALRQSDKGWCAVVHDAKRAEVYFGARHRDGVLQEPVLLAAEDAVQRMCEFARAGHGAPVLAGTAAAAFATRLEPLAVAAEVSATTQPDAIFVARLAMLAPEPDHPPRPLYLRAPDARLPAP